MLLFSWVWAVTYINHLGSRYTVWSLSITLVLAVVLNRCVLTDGRCNCLWSEGKIIKQFGLLWLVESTNQLIPTTLLLRNCSWLTQRWLFKLLCCVTFCEKVFFGFKIMKIHKLLFNWKHAPYRNTKKVHVLTFSYTNNPNVPVHYLCIIITCIAMEIFWSHYWHVHFWISKLWL